MRNDSSEKLCVLFVRTENISWSNGHKEVLRRPAANPHLIRLYESHVEQEVRRLNVSYNYEVCSELVSDTYRRNGRDVKSNWAKNIRSHRLPIEKNRTVKKFIFLLLRLRRDCTLLLKKRKKSEVHWFGRIPNAVFVRKLMRGVPQ